MPSQPFTIGFAITVDEANVAALAELAKRVLHDHRRDMSVESDAEAARAERMAASQHAHFGGQKPPEDCGLLIDSREAAKMLRVSTRTLYTMYTTGTMPPPIRIGRAVRFAYEELLAWVNAGCPRVDGAKG